MSKHSKIEWIDATWNPVRRGNGSPYEQGFDLRIVPQALSIPLRWRRPRRIFVNSMSDLFQDGVPSSFVHACFGVMYLAGQHVYQVLTKRADRMREHVTRFCELDRDALGEALNHYDILDASSEWLPPEDWPLPNVWLGVSVEDRKYGLPRIDHLRQTPAAVRFLSVEPLLEDLGAIDLTGIHWVIVGGESGHGVRPMHPDWVRSIRDQCLAAKVPFFFKQWGEWALRSREDGQPFDTLANHNRDKLLSLDGTQHCTRGPAGDAAVPISRIGKHKAGRLLDGRTWDEMPGGAE